MSTPSDGWKLRGQCGVVRSMAPRPVAKGTRHVTIRMCIKFLITGKPTTTLGIDAMKGYMLDSTIEAYAWAQ